MRMLKTILLGGVGLALSFTLYLGLAGNALAVDKVTVCHVTDSATNPYLQISVSNKAVVDHIDHGDGLLGDDDNCGTCGTVCGTGKTCQGGACVPACAQIGTNANCSACGDTCSFESDCVSDDGVVYYCVNVDVPG